MLGKNSLGALNFTIESRPVAAQIDLLLANGYQHISFWGSANGGRSVAEYFADERVANGELSIAGVLYDINVDQGDDPVVTAKLLGELEGKGAALWLLLEGQDQERLVDTVRTIADLAEARRVPVVLYPHQFTAMPDAESANQLRLTAERANVSLSLHLCHELKAGNRDRLAEVIHHVIGSVSLATVSGADTDFDTQSSDWTHTIMPLDRGDFDVQEQYVRPLLEAGYSGPIVLHTFGITDPPEDHYQRSAQRWREMVSALRAR